jgi:hypothetical protein
LADVPTGPEGSVTVTVSTFGALHSSWERTRGKYERKEARMAKNRPDFIFEAFFVSELELKSVLDE